MAKDFSAMEDSNRCANPSIHEVSQPDRRTVLRGGLGALAGALLAPLTDLANAAQVVNQPALPLLGFQGIAPSSADAVVVPDGYTAQVIARWGDPVGIPGAAPAFLPNAGNPAAHQEVQFGMHNDGMHYFPLKAPNRGLLVMNHEYTDEGLLYPDGFANWSPEKVRKAQAAHGISVCEIQLKGDQWQVVPSSRYARRLTANTPFAVHGPAAGHALLQTAADPQGRTVLGTLNNCASGITPWGTYLSGEENFIEYFNGGDALSPHELRWGLEKDGKGGGYRWHEHDARFDAVQNPNEPNRFGWVVEVDPYDAGSTPIKRTALGRAAHEGATTTVTQDGRAVVYMGEDARFEYIYKFISRDKVQPGGAKANRALLDDGTLYVAQFNADGRGQWLALTHGQGPLTTANGFADQGEVVVKTRQASDLLGATKMDRPEWLTIDREGWVYCSLTNNTDRGTAKGTGPDAANPRANNSMGQIIRWKEDGDFDGRGFVWNHFVLAGDPELARADAKGNIQGDLFASPDGLWTDARGVLWIETDMSSSRMGKGDFARMGNNALLAADPRSGEVRRFLVGPRGCEITGATATPDGRTMFINIQHPGEAPRERNKPDQPRAHSNWPDFLPHGRPRSATVVIRKKDGGLIGT